MCRKQGPMHMKQKPKLPLLQARCRALTTGIYGRGIVASVCPQTQREGLDCCPSICMWPHRKYPRKLDWAKSEEPQAVVCECQLALVRDTSDPAKTQPPAGNLLTFNGPPPVTWSHNMLLTSQILSPSTWCMRFPPQAYSG